jgi:hypothetical protein
MRPHYILESGIRPWEESEPPKSRFATLSIVASGLADLLPIINRLLPALGGRFLLWFRWHTLRHVFEVNALQKLRLTDKLSSDAGRFRSPVVRTTDRIISSVASIELPITLLELNTLSDYRRELMIGTADPATTAETVSALMAKHSEGCDPRALADVLDARDDLVFGRCFDDPDTHAAFQWFGQEPDLRLVKELLVGLSVRSLTSRSEVANILRK